MTVATRKLSVGAWILAVLIAVGLIPLWFVCIFGGTELLTAVVGARSENQYRSLAFQLDGTPLLHAYQFGSHYTDLEGHAVENPRKVMTLSVNVLEGEAALKLWSGNLLHLQLASWLTLDDPKACWYFVWNEDQPLSGYFEGFNPITRERLGFIGANGAQQFSPPVEDQFSIKYDHSPLSGHGNFSFGENRTEPSNSPAKDVLLVTRKGVSRVDPLGGTVDLIVEDPDVISAEWASEFVEMTVDGKLSTVQQAATRRVLTRTQDRVLMTDLNDGAVRTWHLPETYAKDANTFILLEDQTLIAIVQRWRSLQRGTHDVNEFSAAYLRPTGELLKEIHVPFDSSGSVNWSEEVIPFLCGVPSVPAVLMVVLNCDGWHWTAYGLLLFVYALVAVMLSLRHATQHHVRIPWYWYSLFLVFGIPGYFGYRWHREWPPLTIPPVPAPTGMEIVLA